MIATRTFGVKERIRQITYALIDFIFLRSLIVSSVILTLLLALKTAVSIKP